MMAARFNFGTIHSLPTVPKFEVLPASRLPASLPRRSRAKTSGVFAALVEGALAYLHADPVAVSQRPFVFERTNPPAFTCWPALDPLLEKARLLVFVDGARILSMARQKKFLAYKGVTLYRALKGNTEYSCWYTLIPNKQVEDGDNVFDVRRLPRKYRHGLKLELDLSAAEAAPSA
jgi:hypothetical protein